MLMVAILRACLTVSVLVHGALAIGHNDTKPYAANLLQESMIWMDMYYDSDRAYLYSLDATALTHDTRSSVWYAAGLLARNEDDDVTQAIRIVKNVVGAQFKNESLQW
jgi:hypothetical protein